MPILDSFTLDHTRMMTPSVRIAKIMYTAHNDVITVFDLRFCQPNLELMSERGVHTLEHLLANFMRNYLNEKIYQIIDISPMGCRTGFYMSVIGTLDEYRVINAWRASMKDILKINKQNQIPEINEYQCGSFKMHSLKEAQEIAQRILNSTIYINDNNELAIPKCKLSELKI